MSDFYLTLPSNSSMDVYPENTMANFKTKLPSRVELTGRWEVGLVEIQYPHSWYNLSEVEELIITPAVSEEEGTPMASGEPYIIRIPPGYYPTITDLTKRIEEEIGRAMSWGKKRNKNIFDYDDITRKVSVKLTKNPFPFSLTLSATIQRILGFESNTLHVGTTEGVMGVDMDPLHSIYVYCDLVEKRVVGDKMVPLLRVIPAEGNHGEMVTRIYENVHYVPIQLKSFEGVEIDIRDNTGVSVPFERGTLNVTLHFRRRQRIL